MKSEYKNNFCKINARTCSEQFNIEDGSYSVSDIQDYFEFIIKKHETIADEDYPIKVYANKIKKTELSLKLNQDIN